MTAFVASALLAMILAGITGGALAVAYHLGRRPQPMMLVAGERYVLPSGEAVTIVKIENILGHMHVDFRKDGDPADRHPYRMPYSSAALAFSVAAEAEAKAALADTRAHRDNPFVVKKADPDWFRLGSQS